MAGPSNYSNNNAGYGNTPQVDAEMRSSGFALN